MIRARTGSLALTSQNVLSKAATAIAASLRIAVSASCRRGRGAPSTHPTNSPSMT